MPDIAFYEPELGQLAFGNPWGSFDIVDNEFVSYFLSSIASYIEIKMGTSQWASKYGIEFSNDTFSMFPYYWGDCQCGYEDKEIEFSEQHPHTEQCFNTRFRKKEESLHEFLSYREKDGILTEWAKENGYKKAPNGMAIYCNCPRKDAYNLFDASHKPTCPTIWPNFKFGDIEISWYKYIGRGMSANRNVTREEWRKVYISCQDSLSSLKVMERFAE